MLCTSILLPSFCNGCYFVFRYVWGGLLVVFGIYLNVYGKKTKGTPFLVSVQQLYMKVQRQFAPKLNTITDKETPMFNV